VSESADSLPVVTALTAQFPIISLGYTVYDKIQDHG